ncbi:phosphoesterase [Stenotrophomonas phage YB07]|uniref:Phosphohydrolase n=1 Tax=Stenotrophomonas phage YB07 TaxID=2555548 RepID=A0A482ID21_9CAUD|nr:phosphoesterase [Stenotrophomonas phage YB07]QBP06329.1 phosphoesterase [Stenotrophomonas phage YB07]
MSEIFFCSDHHFTHRNLMKWYPDRNKYDTPEEMDEAIIERHNAVVGKRDVVYLLGDFGFGSKDSIAKIAWRLNGQKHFLSGNHDKGLLNHDKFRRAFSSILPPLHMISINGQKIVLCHFPIWEWEGIHHGVWHLHGHLHGSQCDVPGKILDVGIDTNELRPYHMDTVKAHMDARPIRNHH